eukprot:scaffold211447_cov18-Tisochrysis_lutea.AAC.1
MVAVRGVAAVRAAMAAALAAMAAAAARSGRGFGEGAVAEGWAVCWADSAVAAVRESSTLRRAAGH